jgi:citrate lyase beta subunit
VLTDATYAELDAALASADAGLAAHYPGEDGRRAPVHTVYVSADRYTEQLPHEWGQQALAAVDELIATPDELAALLDLDPATAADVLPRVRAKLAQEPIEDLRIDFEDGYGPHSDAEEDSAASFAGRVLATSWTQSLSPPAVASPPPFAGIRFRSLEPATRRRGVRTVDRFLSAWLAAAPWPPNSATLLLTLPKVTHVDQVSAFVGVCVALEAAHGLPTDALRFEIQIETPQAVLAADGTAALARMIHAGAGRIVGLHYGTYDYSAATGISAPYQSLEHPVADYAKAVMQVAAAGTGVAVSDGSTNIVPVGSPAEIRTAWRLHGRLVRRSLERGFYQGWDLHPLQLVTRYASTYAFYRDGLPSAADRLRTYLEQSRGDGAAGTAGAFLDEPATAQAMAALLVRGLHCGALDAGEVRERSGADAATLEKLYRRRVG